MGDAKMVRTSSIFMQLFWRSAAAQRREKEKLGVSVLFDVTLWILNLNKGLAHQRFSDSNSDIVSICRSILMRISAFLKKEMLFQMFEKTFELCCKVAPHLP